MSNTNFSEKSQAQKPIDKKFILFAVCCIAATVIIFLLGFFVGRSVGKSEAVTNSGDGKAQVSESDVTADEPHTLETDSALNQHENISNPNRVMASQSSEIRGIYIATVQNINYPSTPGLTADQLKYELDAIIAVCIDTNLNTIYFQVRPSSDAFYKSDIFPVSQYLTGT